MCADSDGSDSFTLEDDQEDDLLNFLREENAAKKSQAAAAAPMPAKAAMDARFNRFVSPAQTVHSRCLVENSTRLVYRSASPQLIEVCRWVDSNRLKPGDPGFNYDVRVDFHDPVEDNEWDGAVSET